MTMIGERLRVKGPDSDGEYELSLLRRDCGSGDHYYFITRAEADALIDALSVRDASGRVIAPPQPTTPARPSGPHEGNADAREPVWE